MLFFFPWHKEFSVAVFTWRKLFASTWLCSVRNIPWNNKHETSSVSQGLEPIEAQLPEDMRGTPCKHVYNCISLGRALALLRRSLSNGSHRPIVWVVFNWRLCSIDDKDLLGDSLPTSVYFVARAVSDRLVSSIAGVRQHTSPVEGRVTKPSTDTIEKCVTKLPWYASFPSLFKRTFRLSGDI